MRLSLSSIWRCRPRMLTMLVFAAVAATIALSNLSCDRQWVHGISYKSYGWPFVWHRYVVLQMGYIPGTIGWYWSGLRLAVNIAIWIAALAVAAGAAEWFARRHPMRPAWSMRAMLVFVTLAAAFCGWFAVARKRAIVQDAVLVAVPAHEPRIAYRAGPPAIRVVRCGPKWLDLMGLDRFRRHITSMHLRTHQNFLDANNGGDEQLLEQLAKLPDLRSLSFQANRLSPTMVAALGDMRQLRYLRIELHDPPGDDGMPIIACLPALTGLPQLEELELRDALIDDRSLSGLPNLKSLSLNRVASILYDEDRKEQRAWHVCLQALGQIKQLERLRLSSNVITSDGLGCLAPLQNLKILGLDDQSDSVNLFWASSENGHAQKTRLFDRLPALSRLEALDLSGKSINDDGLRHLAVLPRLRSLSLRATSVTVTGLAHLALLPSLAELTVEDGFFSNPAESDEAVAAKIDALLAIKGLAKLHLGQIVIYGSGWDRLNVEGDDDFSRILETLSKRKPGLVIDGDPAPRHWWRQPDELTEQTTSNDDCFPDRDAAWLPASDWPAILPSWKVDFESKGGWARFDGANCPYSSLRGLPSRVQF